MGEVQEKCWIVMRTVRSLTRGTSTTPIKVFDDRADARAYAKQRAGGKVVANYSVVGVKKG